MPYHCDDKRSKPELVCDRNVRVKRKFSVLCFRCDFEECQAEEKTAAQEKSWKDAMEEEAAVAADEDTDFETYPSEPIGID